MRILGIDPGLAIMGYGVVEECAGRLCMVDYGTVCTEAGLSMPARLNRIYDGVTELIARHRPDAVVLVGLRATYTFSDRVQITQDLEYSQAMFDPEHYVITSETALHIKLAEVQRGLGIKLAFRDDYDNATQSPNSRNDTRFTAGLTLEF